MFLISTQTRDVSDQQMSSDVQLIQTIGGSWNASRLPEPSQVLAPCTCCHERCGKWCLLIRRPAKDVAVESQRRDLQSWIPQLTFLSFSIF